MMEMLECKVFLGIFLSVSSLLGGKRLENWNALKTLRSSCVFRDVRVLLLKELNRQMTGVVSF